MHPVKLILLVAVCVAFAACTSSTSTIPSATATDVASKLSTACETAAEALNTATQLRAAGKLTSTQITTIGQAAGLINPLCTAPVAPVDATTALSVVVQEVPVVTAIITGVK